MGHDTTVAESHIAATERNGINVIRGLAMDAPHAARSGHQGTAMALAPLAHVLYTRIMKYDAADPSWPDRDRFILSAGHASILQYAMLYLTGFGLGLDDLKRFRQWGSSTPGHPEVHHTAGVEVTTGPLGQGVANAVGMAIAERWMRTRYGPEITDHNVFVVCGDGDLSEGISHEAASLAGHQRLGRLVCIYDDNHISIDGPTELTLSDDVCKRFSAYGWHVDDIGEAAEDLEAIEVAIRKGLTIDDAPSLIVVRSHIGFPSPDQTDNPQAHGYSLFADQISATKELLGLPPEETFFVPEEVLDYYRSAGRRSRRERQAWQDRYAVFAGDRDALDACIQMRGLEDWETHLPDGTDDKTVATRKASGQCLAAAASVVPGLMSGSADLTGNTGTDIGDPDHLSAESPGARQLYYGVREHAMGAIMNGMALHGGIIPVGGTFLVFSDYMRPAVRLAALSKAKVIYSWTHDSVGVGEDGPTHQPVEQIMALRTIPGLRVIRPADANEVAGAWKIAINSEGPTALILTRQDVPSIVGTSATAVSLGAYNVHSTEDPDVVLVGTGSEVSVCMDAAALLREKGKAANVVSMPSWNIFDDQNLEYRESILVPGVPSVSVEAGVTLGWAAYVDRSIGINRFGASAPGAVVMSELGVTAENVVQQVRELLDF